MKLALLAGLLRANAEAPRLPAVPQVFNAGADGMPQLPNVERLLADFQDVKQNLNSQASSFAEHLSKVERASLQRIEKQKAVYDAKLREQEKGNQALVRSNAHLAKEIITARQRSAELSKQVGAAEKLVSFRRSELQALDQQLSRADKFVKQTLSATDPEAEDMSKAAKEAESVSFLEVSEQHVKHKVKKSLRSRHRNADSPLAVDPSVNSSELEVESEDDLLSQPKSADEDQIIDLLTEDLRHLHKAEASSQAKLKAMFHESFEAGKKRHSALLQQEGVLKKELAQSRSSIRQLKSSAQRLQGVLEKLHGSLKQGGDFLGELRQAALAPVKEVPALLKEAATHAPAA
ncbi:unnamed protein product [Effrenium voratum]|nr:unnamed protein product [Effrenium voratum]